MGSLCAGFESLGYQAGGFTDANLVDNNIFGNAWAIFNAVNASKVFSAFHPVTSILCAVFTIVIVILLILTGIEMFMARIEFWTLAMATIPMVPFAALPQTRFLFTSALGGMMNLAIKVSVIAFITAITSNILKGYIDAFVANKDGHLGADFALFIQATLVSFLLYLIVKKLPELVSSLLSGSPSLNGATMKQMAQSAASTGAKVGTAVATGGAAVGKAVVGGAMQGGFKAAGAAAANGGGRGSQIGHGMLGAVGGAMNAGAGSLMSGAKGLASQALFGNGGASGGSGSGGSSGLGGGLLAPFQRGAQLGKQFSNKDKDGFHKTFTGMTGIDKASNAVKDYMEDKKQNGADKAKARVLDNISSGASNLMNKAKMSVAQSSNVGKAYTQGYSDQAQRIDKYKPKK